MSATIPIVPILEMEMATAPAVPILEMATKLGKITATRQEKTTARVGDSVRANAQIKSARRLRQGNKVHAEEDFRHVLRPHS
jgi:hypothetical protein